MRRRLGLLRDYHAFYQTLEDLVLAKLRMIKATKPRERALNDKEDIRAILKFTKVDIIVLKSLAGRENSLSIFEVLMGE